MATKQKITWRAKLSINRPEFDTRQLFFKNYVAASLITNLLVIVTVLVVGSFLPPQVPLLYGLAEGEEQLVPAWALIIPGLTAMIILTINVLISLKVEDDFLKKTLLLTAMVATFFSTITTLKIIFLVGSF
jgi:uncharacterized membrane protein YozB (DUF420 family)